MTFFPTAGNRNHSTGVLSSVGSGGYFWLPCVSGNDAGYVYIDGTRLFLNFNARTLSFPLRCVQEIADCSGNFPSAGCRHNMTGVLTNVGSEGDVWSSMRESTLGLRLIFSGAFATSYGTNRAFGYPLRCVQAFMTCSGMALSVCGASIP